MKKYIVILYVNDEGTEVAPLLKDEECMWLFDSGEEAAKVAEGTYLGGRFGFELLCRNRYVS